MAHPEKHNRQQEREREGGGLLFLNSSSVGQRKAGYREETICVRVRP